MKRTLDSYGLELSKILLPDAFARPTTGTELYERWYSLNNKTILMQLNNLYDEIAMNPPIDNKPSNNFEYQMRNLWQTCCQTFTNVFRGYEKYDSENYPEIKKLVTKLYWLLSNTKYENCMIYGNA